MWKALAVALVVIAATLPAAARPEGPTGVWLPVPRWLDDHARAQVRAVLGAPQTARFRRVHAFRLSDGGWAVCGQVNSRAATSLRQGWKPIYLRYRPEGGRSFRLARRIVDWPADVACRYLDMGWKLRTGW